MSPSGVKSIRPPGPGKRLWRSALLPATHCALWRALLLIQGQSLTNWQQPEVAQVAPRGSWEGLGPGQQDTPLTGSAAAANSILQSV